MAEKPELCQRVLKCAVGTVLSLGIVTSITYDEGDEGSGVLTTASVETEIEKTHGRALSLSRQSGMVAVRGCATLESDAASLGCPARNVEKYSLDRSPPPTISPASTTTVPGATIEEYRQAYAPAAETPPPVPADTLPPPEEAPPPPEPQTPEQAGVWDELAACESSGNWQADTGNGYYGGLQFSLPSWESVGGEGYPQEAPREEQIDRAELLQDRQGWEAWPACSRKLGL